MSSSDTTTTDSLSAGNSRCLRLGVLLNSLVVPLWIHRALDEIDRAGFAELAVIVTINSSRCSSRDWIPENGPLLFRRWVQLDKLVFHDRSAKPGVFDLSPIEFRRSHPLILDIESDGDNCVNFSSGEKETLSKAGVDVILNFVPALPVDEIVGFSKCGLLSFENPRDSLDALYWALYNGEPVLTHELKLTSAHSVTSRLFRSYSALDRISLFRNYSSLCRKRSDTLVRFLNNLYRSRCWMLDETVEITTTHRKPRPGNMDILRMTPRLLSRFVREQVTKRLLREEWFVAFRNRSEKALEFSSPFIVLHPPHGHFYADPFLMERNGKAYIFFENYSFERRKANISFVELDSKGGCSSPEVALEESYHLAYPDVFEWQGEIYMVPETKENRTIQLYRATDFPKGWKLEQVLLSEVSGVDSTILCHDGNFWLFTAGLGTKDPWFDGDCELFLFFSDSLLGPWMPHPQNPIVRDVRRCRPAGELFFWNGQLIRPAQDCSLVYGHAVCFNRVETISANEYRETPIGSIGPEWMAGNRGTHTYNHCEHYEVMDGRTLIARFFRGRPRPVLQTIGARRSVASRAGALS